MFNHCKPYKCNIFWILSAVLTILLGATCVSAFAEPYSKSLPRVALLGDSMTWIGGDSCQNKIGWSFWLKESRLVEAIDVYARSGATWTNTKSTLRNPNHYTELLHNDNVLFNQAIRLIERCDTADAVPDLIILFAGANDAWFSAKRPGIFDLPAPQLNNQTTLLPNYNTTLAGSVSLVSDMLHTRFPDATLLFVAPLQMSKTDAETIQKVSDIIESSAKEKGWITLRADKETAITHRQEAKSHKYTSDGVHTNQAGAKILGDYIIRYLQNLSTPQPKTEN